MHTHANMTLRAMTAVLALCCVVIFGVQGQSTVLFGTYTPTTPVFDALNAWLTYKNQSVGIVEVGWGPTSGIPEALSDIEAVWESGAVPIVTWMPYPYIHWTSPTPNADIVNGVYDGYISAFFSALQSFLSGQDQVLGTEDDRRAYLRFAPQPNGDWFPWSPYCPSCGSTGQHINQSIASYTAMFNYVVAKGRASPFQLSTDVLQVMWCINEVDVSGPSSAFYPGDADVDWTAVVGFNWGNTVPGNQWTHPRELFSAPLSRLRDFAASKPVALATVASTSVPNGVSAKARWLNSLFSYLGSLPPQVHMLAFHNADGATDFGIFGGSRGDIGVDHGQYLAYREILTNIQQHAWILGSDAKNPRLISNAAFRGSNSTPVPPPGPTSSPPPPTTIAPPPTPNSNCPCDTADTRAALRELYDATQGADWTRNADWLSSAPICNWYGISCPASNPFLTITLNSINLRGTLPDWGNHPTFLSLIQYFDLDNNEIAGTLPASWSSMTNVQTFLIYTNAFEGTIPDSWAAMTNVTDFQVQWNKLSGTLPAWVSQFSQAEYLTFSFNQFVGALPSSWCDLVGLDGVEICGNSAFGPETNKFCGPAPACWANNEALNVSYTNCLPLPYC